MEGNKEGKHGRTEGMKRKEWKEIRKEHMERRKEWNEGLEGRNGRK